MQIMKLDQIPNLEEFEVASVDLSYEYWTPEKDGEARRLFFMGVESMDVPDHQDPEKNVSLDCAVFFQPDSKGDHKTVVNGSVRLKSIVEKLDAQTPVQVTYRGKKKNRSNGNMSDQWSVVTLQKKGGK